MISSFFLFAGTSRSCLPAAVHAGPGVRAGRRDFDSKDEGRLGEEEEACGQQAEWRWAADGLERQRAAALPDEDGGARVDGDREAPPKRQPAREPHAHRPEFHEQTQTAHSQAKEEQKEVKEERQGQERQEGRGGVGHGATPRAHCLTSIPIVKGISQALFCTFDIRLLGILLLRSMQFGCN